MKEINLVPPYAAFDYKKYIITRTAIFVLLINIITLIVIFFISSYFNLKLQKLALERKTYLSSITEINKTFSGYKAKYIKMKKQLKRLQDKIVYYKRLKTVHRSAFADSIVFLNTFTEGITFNSVSYKLGSFTVTGTATDKQQFQIFFGELEQNRFISDARFYFLKRNKNGNYSFKISYRVVLAW